MDAEVNKRAAVGRRGRRKFRPQAGPSTDSRAWGQPRAARGSKRTVAKQGTLGLQGLVLPELQTEAGSDRRLGSCPLVGGQCASDLGLCWHLCLSPLGVKGVCEHVCACLPALSMCICGCSLCL